MKQKDIMIFGKNIITNIFNILNENISVTENIKFIRKNNDEVTVETNSFYFEEE